MIIKGHNTMKIIQCAVFLAAAVDGSKATMDTPGFVNLPSSNSIIRLVSLSFPLPC